MLYTGLYLLIAVLLMVSTAVAQRKKGSTEGELMFVASCTVFLSLLWPITLPIEFIIRYLKRGTK